MKPFSRTRRGPNPFVVKSRQKSSESRQNRRQTRLFATR